MSPRSTQEEYIEKLRQQLEQAEAKIAAKRQAVVDKLVAQIKAAQDKQVERQAAFTKRIEQQTTTHNEWMAKQDGLILELQEQLDELGGNTNEEAFTSVKLDVVSNDDDENVA